MVGGGLDYKLPIGLINAGNRAWYSWNAINCFCSIRFFGDDRFINFGSESSEEIILQTQSGEFFWDVLVWQEPDHGIQPSGMGDQTSRTGRFITCWTVPKCDFTSYGWNRCSWAKNEEGRLAGLIVERGMARLFYSWNSGKWSPLRAFLHWSN